MQTWLIIIASLGVAYLAGALAQRRSFTLADLAAGTCGALVGLGMAQFLGNARVEGAADLALVIACGLTLGIASLQERSHTAN
jgi:hypothetical protein